MNQKKVVVITGASSGIGAETALLLAKDGVSLVLAARREERLIELVNTIQKLGAEAIYLVTDVKDVNQVEHLAQAALTRFGRIDVWINNAGLMPQSLLSQKKIEDWDAMIDINIKGTLYGIGAALPTMISQQSGHIINISSVAGHFAHAGSAVYSATKWAVRAISESLREEMAQAKTNVRVTIISPGAINTELVQSLTDDAFKKNFTEYYDTYGIDASRVALTIKQAIDLPDDAAWNEVIIRPTKQIR